MAQDASFDIVSETDLQEVSNAIQQAKKELATRFDFKGSKSEIELKEGEIILVSDDEYKLKSLRDILESKMVKRRIDLKALDYQKVEDAAMGTVRQHVKVRNGIETEKAKEIVKIIKTAKLKVQAAIQGSQVRVSGKKKDDLQEAIRLLRESNLDIPLQFTNYRG